MTAETDRLIKGTYETDKTICGVRKIYRNNSRWSVVVPLLIRQRSEYQNEKTCIRPSTRIQIRCL